LHQVLDDRKSQPASFGFARPRFVAAIETFEHSRQICRGDSCSRVFDDDRYAALRCLGRYRDRSARSIELHGVVDQVIENLLEPFLIGANNHPRWNHGMKRYPGACLARIEKKKNVVDNAMEINRALCKLNLSRFDGR